MYIHRVERKEIRGLKKTIKRKYFVNGKKAFFVCVCVCVGLYEKAA